MKKLIYQLGTILLLLVIWEFVVGFLNIPSFLLPGPIEIITVFIQNFSILTEHAFWTLSEILSGFFVAVIFAFIVAILGVYSRYVKEIIHPMLVGVQIVPKIALIPLLLIWFGHGILPKLITVSLVCFFPIFINLNKGIESVNKGFINIMKAAGSTKTEILRNVQIPYSLPYLFTGLKIGIALASVGAIVAEFISSSVGLGYQISYSASLLDSAMVFAGLLYVVLIGLIMYFAVVLMEKRVVFWREEL